MNVLGFSLKKLDTVYPVGTAKKSVRPRQSFVLFSVIYIYANVWMQ